MHECNPLFLILKVKNKCMNETILKKLLLLFFLISWRYINK